MNISIDYKTAKGEIKQRKVRRAYITKFVVPSRIYPVSYTMDNRGNRINEPAMLKGEDLTENQIAELFSRELL